MSKPIFFIVCPECNSEHREGAIKAENIEENIQGQDVITYQCPVTKKLTKAVVLTTYGE